MPKLHPHIGRTTLWQRMLPYLAVLAIAGVVEGLLVSLIYPATPIEREKAALAREHSGPVPEVLGVEDLVRYRAAFALQQSGDFDAADKAINEVGDPLLKGVLLGERYLRPGGAPNFSEAALWLSRYSDHAQAGELYRIVRSRAPDDADFLTEPQVAATLKGFGNGYDKSALAGGKHWVSGLVAFRRHDMNAAAAHFRALWAGEKDRLNRDDRAASAFWAWRTSAAAGLPDAMHYLESAAAEPPGFYSIIARQVMAEPAMQAAGAGSQVESGADFLRKEAVRRAIALKAIGQDALAEKEIRAQFTALGKSDKGRLLQLASLLGLPGVQLRMAVAGAYDPSAGNAMYPLPRWKPTLGYRIEPALLFAIMRQESGFNPHAHNASGAAGVMQLMPATASAMAQDARLKVSNEPAVSMTLGQHYLERLMDISFVGDNLIYVLASYNAGPGSVAAWQRNLHFNNDPLLFVESLPREETRDYVVHVMGNYWVYSQMLGGYDNASVAALAEGHWPRYTHSDQQKYVMVSRLGASDGAE